MILLSVFIFVTLSQAVFLLAAKRSRNENFKKKLWNFHYSFNGILWVLLIVWIILFQFNSEAIGFSAWVRIIGSAIFLVGAVLSFINVKRLGLRQAMGFRFFSKQKLQWISGGTYSFLHNPIYDGFILIFLGAGFWGGVIINFYLALASFILLNVILASIEKEQTRLDLRELL